MNLTTTNYEYVFDLNCKSRVVELKRTRTIIL